MNTIFSFRRALPAALIVAVTLAGCGGGDNEPNANQSTGAQNAQTTPSVAATPDPNAASLAVLRTWEDELLSTLISARDRARAFEAGDTAKAAKLEARMKRELRSVRHYGRDARKTLLDVLDTKPAKATIAAGDAWTQWAYETLTHPPAGDFEQARRIADLGARAIRAYQTAYRAAGSQPPPAFRTR